MFSFNSSFFHESFYLLLEYTVALDKLQSPVPEPIVCHPECSYTPVCHTDFEPHFNDKFYLHDIVIGDHPGWELHQPRISDDDIRFGYKDRRPLFLSTGGQYDLHLKVMVGRSQQLTICGATKGALAKITCYINYNGTFHLNNVTLGGGNLSMTDLLFPTWNLVEHWKHLPDDCMQLLNLKEGNHILTIQTNATGTDHTTSLSHVVEFL